MKAKKQTIIPPPNGWEENTYYVVEVSYNKNNPIHGAIFFSGFLNGGPINRKFEPITKFPGGYNEIGFQEDPTDITEVFYMKVIRKLITDDELEKVPNADKLPTEPLI